MTARAPDSLDIERLNAEGRKGMATLRSKERYYRRLNRGLCTRADSHGKAEIGHTVCIGCLVDQRFDQNARNRRTRPAKRVLTCIRCGKPGRNSRGCPCPVPPGFDPQRAKVARGIEYRAALRAKGLCPNNPNHEKPGPGYSQCAACRARKKATR
jgi:hypothetical protein